MEDIIAGFHQTLTFWNILFIASGVFVGQVIGAIPGLNGPLVIAVTLPLTFYLSPIAGISFLIGVSKGSMFGGSISAILINTPGTPEAAPTAFDGYPLSQKGQGLKALKMSLYSSVFGATFSDIVLFATAAPAAALALMMGPSEMTAVLLFAFTIIAGLSGNSLLRGSLAAVLGIFISTIGLDSESSLPRMTFGVPELQDGVPLIPMTIGLLALSEVILQAEKYIRGGAGGSRQVQLTLDEGDPDDQVVTRRDWRECMPSIIRSSLIGTGIGALPGIGAVVAGFLGYASAKRASPRSAEFGTGVLEGVAATEAANNAVTGSNLIPLLALGVPGNLTAAILIGAFLIHGIQPGPLIFRDHGALVYGLFVAMALSDLLNLILGLIGIRFFALVVRAPDSLLHPVILIVCTAGAYGVDNSMFSVWVMLIFAIAGYFMRRLDYPFATFLIGFALGREFEMVFRQSIILFSDRPTELIYHPIALGFLALTVFSLLRIVRQQRRDRLLREGDGLISSSA